MILGVGACAYEHSRARAQNDMSRLFELSVGARNRVGVSSQLECEGSNRWKATSGGQVPGKDREFNLSSDLFGHGDAGVAPDVDVQSSRLNRSHDLGVANVGPCLLSHVRETGLSDSQASAGRGIAPSKPAVVGTALELGVSER